MKSISQRVMSLVKQHPILCLLLLIQVGMIIYYNLFQGQYYLGYDASAYYLQVIETWNQKKLLLDHWTWQTTLCWDTPVLLASLFYGLIGNVFVAMGLANLIFIALFCLVLYAIMRRLELSDVAMLLSFCILFTPYMSMPDRANNIQYFFVMYVDFAAYLVKILIIFFLFLVHDRVQAEGIKKFTACLVVASYIALLLTSISSGYFVLIFGVAPMFVMYIVHGMIQDRWDSGKVRAGIYLLGCVLVSLTGKVVATKFLGFESRDTDAVWTALAQFWDNLRSIFVGYLSLTGALPFYEGTNILDKFGVGYLFRFFLSMVILVGAIFGVYQIIKQVKRNGLSNYMSMQMAGVILVNLLVFVLCYTTYGAAIFEVRYLIIIFIVMAMFASKWIDQVVFSSKNRSCKGLISLALCVSLISTNAYAYYYIYYSKNEYDTIQSIIAEVQKTDAPVVYVVGEDLNITARNMRVIDTNHIYRVMNDINTLHRWGDYEYYEDAGDNTGESVLVCSMETYQTLPAYYMSQYELQATVPNTSIGIYVAERNAIDLTVGISDDYNVDYFYTSGMATYEFGTFDENGNFVTDGTGGYATWGPYTAVPVGTYEFTLHYDVKECLSEVAGQFDVAVNATPIGVVDLQAGENTATLEVTFDETSAGGLLEYRSYVNDGAVIALKSVEIKKIS